MARLASTEQCPNAAVKTTISYSFARPHNHTTALLNPLPRSPTHSIITVNTFGDAKYRMTSQNSAEDTLDGLSDTDSGSDFETDMTEEEIKNLWSTKYEHGWRFLKPMKEPLKAPWDVPISDVDVEKLKTGFKSRSMDDKYDLRVENPDDNGNVSLHIFRNWMHEECYILHIVPDSGSAKIQGITWEGNKSGLRCDAEQAKKEAIILSKMFLHCDFEALPDYPTSLLGQNYKRLDAK